MSGLTQAALARVSGLSQPQISRFEDGISQPSDAELNILAQYLRVPVKFFMESDLKRSVFNSFYRKRKSVSQKTLMQFNSRVCFRQVQIDRLLRKSEMDSDPLPRFDPDELKGGNRTIAEALRQLLKLPPGPIKHLVPALEDAGVIIVLDNFGVTKIDGVSTYSNNGSPIIFLNMHAPNSRRRFSLAHEFAHTVLHRYMAPDVDEQADALACELLMPAREIYSDLADSRLTLGRLADLKLKWKVSMAALLFRAKTLEVIKPRQYSYLWAQMSSAGYRIQEPYEDLMVDQEPSLEKELIAFHRRDLGYSIEELADLLDISELEIVKRYDLPDDIKPA
jgi:Zn-dependent peptidase ImmA (M78 family)